MMNQFKPPIKDRKIRFSLAGCGRISKNHFEALKKHQRNADLVAVCDVDPRVLAKAKTATGARDFLNYDQMLKQAQADIVVLATPSGLHPQQTIQAAEAGFHVMTEKPMATRWHDGKRMVAACHAAGVRLFVVKQNRRNATLQLLKRALEKKRFGRIYMVTINVFWTRPQEYYDSAKWRGTWEFDGAITIIGEKGTVRIGGLAVNEIQHWKFSEPDEMDEAIKQASYQTTSVYGFGHPLYYDNVIKVLRGEAEPDTDGREGLRSLELLVAAYTSARDGHRVSLPLDY